MASFRTAAPGVGDAVVALDRLDLPDSGCEGLRGVLVQSQRCPRDQSGIVRANLPHPL